MGLEPTQYHYQQILSLPCLPIPPLGLINMEIRGNTLIPMFNYYSQVNVRALNTSAAASSPLIEAITTAVSESAT